MLKIWDLAKKSHFASVLATEAVNANFLHTMMIYIENGIHDQILKKNVAEILIWQVQLLLKWCFYAKITTLKQYIHNKFFKN